MIRLLLVLFLIVPYVLSGCATAYNPATEQNEFIFITTPAEVSLGKMISGKVSRQFKFSEDKEKIDRAVEVGNKVASVSDRQDLEYYFKVIEDESLNAFTTPGGYIYINSGLIEETSDDELACVIGHEIGHVAARHAAKKLQAQIGYDILMNIASRKGGGLGDLQRAASISFDLISLGYSREDELLSDRLGVKYAYKAGYDPHAMVTFLEKLKGKKDEKLGFVFLRSHPYASQRINVLKEQIPNIVDKVDKKKSIKHVRSQKKTYPEPIQVSTDKARPLKVMCPTCKRIFPGRTNFCPYDGTKL
ncbi:M48 family metallopeptidase [Candidatus Omnitrophota bacterium]